MTALRTAHAFLRYQTSVTFKSAIGMSAEPNRKRAYSSDIRWRIVYQRVGMGLTYPKIATNLNIALSTSHRTFEQTGTVDPTTRNASRIQTRILDRLQLSRNLRDSPGF